MKRSIILLMIAVISCIMIPPALAGTWSDGFEDGNLDEWELAFKHGPTTFRAENGELRMEVHADVISMLRVIGSDQWNDCTVTVRVKILETFGVCVDGGIFMRLSKLPWEGTFYYFFIADEWMGHWYPDVPPEGKGAFAFPHINGQVPEGKVKAFTPEPDYWYTLKAIAQGNHTEFYLDDEFVGEFGYSALRSGSVGLVVSKCNCPLRRFRGDRAGHTGRRPWWCLLLGQARGQAGGDVGNTQARTLKAAAYLLSNSKHPLRYYEVSKRATLISCVETLRLPVARSQEWVMEATLPPTAGTPFLVRRYPVLPHQ